MNEASLQEVISQLDNLFSIFNKKLFADQLQKPILTVSPDTTRGAYGWCTMWKAWHSKDSEGYYEINMCAEYLNRSIYDLSATLIHEMVHLLNLQVGIQDTSRGGRYHNKRFKQTAEEHGLIIDKSEKFGWCITKLNQEITAFVDSLNLKDFVLSRPKVLKVKHSKCPPRKYVCPGCGSKVRAAKEVNIMCADCNCEFELS